MTLYTTFKDHGTPWKVTMLRRFGFVCMGPYHSGMWYVFWGRKALAHVRRHTTNATTH